MNKLLFFTVLCITTNLFCLNDSSATATDQGQQSSGDATIDQLMDNLKAARSASAMAKTTLDQVINQLSSLMSADQATAQNSAPDNASTNAASSMNQTPSTDPYLNQAQSNQAIADLNAGASQVVPTPDTSSAQPVSS